MKKYGKKIYPHKNKSKSGVQHYGFIISIDGIDSIRQWHKPKVMGHSFMTENEANHEADMMISTFVEIETTPPLIEDEEIVKLRKRLEIMEANVKNLSK